MTRPPGIAKASGVRISRSSIRGGAEASSPRSGAAADPRPPMAWQWAQPWSSPESKTGPDLPLALDQELVAPPHSFQIPRRDHLSQDYEPLLEELVPVRLYHDSPDASIRFAESMTCFAISSGSCFSSSASKGSTVTGPS